VTGSWWLLRKRGRRDVTTDQQSHFRLQLPPPLKPLPLVPPSLLPHSRHSTFISLFDFNTCLRDCARCKFIIIFHDQQHGESKSTFHFNTPIHIHQRSIRLLPPPRTCHTPTTTIAAFTRYKRSSAWSFGDISSLSSLDSLVSPWEHIQLR
jgi:hypothetical protein